MIAMTVPYEGDSPNPLFQYVEDMTLDTPEEAKARKDAMRPEDNLAIGGFERLSHFMSATR